MTNISIAMPSSVLGGKILQNKKSNKFRVLFNIEEPHAKRLTVQVKSVTKPRYSAQFDQIDNPTDNSYIYISLEIHDDIMNYAAQAINELIKNKFIMTIEIIDSSADFVLERITIHDCLVLDVDYSPLDYATNTSCMISLNVRGLRKFQEFFNPMSITQEK